MYATYLAESLPISEDAAATVVETLAASWCLVAVSAVTPRPDVEAVALALRDGKAAVAASEIAPAPAVLARVAALVGGDEAAPGGAPRRVALTDLLRGTGLATRVAGARPSPVHIVPLRSREGRPPVGYLVAATAGEAAGDAMRERLGRLGAALAASLELGRTSAAERARAALALAAVRDSRMSSVVPAALQAASAAIPSSTCSLQLVQEGALAERITREPGGAVAWTVADAGVSPSQVAPGGPSPRTTTTADAGRGASSVAEPVLVRGELAASLEVAWPDDHGDAPKRPEALGRIGRDLALALQAVARRSEAAAVDGKLAVVSQTAGRIAAAAGLEEAFEALLLGVGALTGAESGAIQFPIDASALFERHRVYRWLGARRFRSEDAAVAAGSRLDVAIRSARISYVGDHAAEPAALQEREGRDEPEMASRIILPLSSRNRVIGALLASTRRVDGFDDDDVAWLTMLGDLAGALVAQAQFHLEGDRRLRGLEAAQRIAQAVGEMNDVDGMLQRMLDEVARVANCDYGTVLLVDPAGQAMRARVGFRVPPGLLEASVYPLYAAPDPSEDVFSRAVREGDQIVVESEDYPAYNRRLAEQFRIPRHRRVLTPIKDGADVIGILSLLWTGDARPRDEDMTLFRVVADQAGTAIGRARLAEAERLARERLAAALQTANTMVLTFDAAGTIDSVDGSVEALTGWAPGELLNRSILDLLPPTMHPFIVCTLGEWIAGSDEPIRTGLGLVHRSGRIVPVFHAAKPRRVASRFTGGAGAFTDLSAVSDLRVERDAARALQARVEGAVRTGRAVAHDLGSPISTVLALTELLADEPSLPDDIVDDLRTLHQEAMRASQYLRQFARITGYTEMSTPVGPQLDVDQSSPAP